MGFFLLSCRQSPGRPYDSLVAEGKDLEENEAVRTIQARASFRFSGVGFPQTLSSNPGFGVSSLGFRVSRLGLLLVSFRMHEPQGFELGVCLKVQGSSGLLEF